MIGVSPLKAAIASIGYREKGWQGQPLWRPVRACSLSLKARALALASKPGSASPDIGRMVNALPHLSDCPRISMISKCSKSSNAYETKIWQNELRPDHNVAASTGLTGIADANFYRFLMSLFRENDTLTGKGK
jgi:hypothetical protein